MYIIKKVIVLLCTILVVTAFCLFCSATMAKNQRIRSDKIQPPNPADKPEAVQAIHNESSEPYSDSRGESGENPGNPAPSESSGDSTSNSRNTSGTGNEDNTSQNSSSPSQGGSNEQVVFVLKGNTAQISEELLLRLTDIIKSQTNSVSFYYENLDTGIVIASTPDKAYFCASVIKAPYIASILKKGIDLTDVVTIKDNVCDMPAGTELTVDQLIYYSLVYSDNNSYIELVRKYGRAVFNNYSEELGVTCRLQSGNFCNMTAYEAAVYFKDIYRYALESEDGKYLAEYMKKPVYNQQIGRDLSKKYSVVQKYGASYNLSVFHNTAVVCAPSPYVLSIFTDFYPSGSSAKVFRDIAAVIDEINTAIAEQSAVPAEAEESAAD